MQIRRSYYRTCFCLLMVTLFFPACTREAKKARFMAKADGYFKAGQYEEARIEYLNALGIDRKDAEGYLKVGIIWFQQGDIIQGLRYLGTAANLAPDNVEAHSQIGAAYAALGNMVFARKEAMTVLKLAPDNGDAILLLCNSVRSKADEASAAQELEKFPNHNTAAFQMASAILLFRNGDLAGGEKAVRQAIALDPNYFQAHLALGDIYLGRNDPANAEEEYKAAADVAPPRSAARLRYVNFLLQTGAQDKAKAVLEEILTTTPDYLPATLMKAQIAINEKDLDKALALINGILGRDPVDMDAHLMQAQLSMAKGDAKSAIQDLLDLGSPYVEVPVVQYQLAQAYLQNRDMPSAVDALKRAITASPGYTDAILLLSTIYLQTGNAQQVVAPLQGLVKSQPYLDRATILLATAYKALKQYDEAIGLYQDQVKRDPKNAQAYFLMAMTYLDKGDPANARPGFEKAQALRPNDLACTYQLVDLDIAAGDFNGAIKRVQSQIDAQPKAAGAQFLLGRIYAAQKDWPNAEAALTKALDEDPNSTVSSEMLTSVYVRQNQLDKAIVQAQSFVDKHPGSAAGMMVLGHLYEVTHQEMKGRETYEKILEANPEYAPALNNLAFNYAAKKNDLDKAKELAEKAHALLPDDAGVDDTLGWVLYERGEYKEALDLLQQSAAKPPVDPEILFHLGMANYVMDYPDAARTALQQASQSPVDFPGKADIAAKLAILENGSYANSSPGQLDAILKQQPGDLYTEMALGDAWLRTGDPAKAATAYEQVVAQNPNLAAATLDLAELYAGPLHEPGKASDMAKKARELAPNDPRGTEIMGKAAFATNDFVQAYNLLVQVVASGTDDAAAAGDLQDYAWAAYSQGKIDEARGAMERIVKAAPPTAAETQDAQSFLTLTDSDPGASAVSDADLTKTLQTTPNYVPALMVRAQRRLKQGDAQGAAADCLAALQRFPDFPLAQKTLAGAYLRDPQNQAKAYDLAVKAHNALPDDAEASNLLAAASYQRKDYSYAASLLQQSAAKGPLDVESLYYLGMSLSQLNEKPAGREALKQAIAGGLAEPDLSEAKRVLAGPAK